MSRHNRIKITLCANTHTHFESGPGVANTNTHRMATRMVRTGRFCKHQTISLRLHAQSYNLISVTFVYFPFLPPSFSLALSLGKNFSLLMMIKHVCSNPASSNEDGHFNCNLVLLGTLGGDQVVHLVNYMPCDSGDRSKKTHRPR